VRDQLLIHLAGDDDSVDVPFEEKPRHIFVGVKLVPHRRQEYIIVVVAGLKLRPEEYPGIKGLGLGEVFFGEYEPDIPACFGRKASRRARGVVCKFPDNLLDRLAGRGLTFPRLLITSETVESDNPAFLATSRMVGRCFTLKSSKRFNA